LPRAWIKWAKFEEKAGETALARAVFERAMQELDERDHTEDFFIGFAQARPAPPTPPARSQMAPARRPHVTHAPHRRRGVEQFEERAKETERARTIYKYALEALPKSRAADVYKKYVTFEKQHGDRRGIEDVITAKKRFQYEEAVKRDPYLYDAWFDYVKLEEEALANAADDADADSHARVRDVYERAIANVPPSPDKRLWRCAAHGISARHSAKRHASAADVPVVAARSRRRCFDADAAPTPTLPPTLPLSCLRSRLQRRRRLSVWCARHKSRARVTTGGIFTCGCGMLSSRSSRRTMPAELGSCSPSAGASCRTPRSPLPRCGCTQPTSRCGKAS
jgi:hypothetical protein